MRFARSWIASGVLGALPAVVAHDVLDGVCRQQAEVKRNRHVEQVHGDE